MQLLNGTSQTLSFITSYAVATTVIVDYIEVGHSTFVPKSKTINISSATTTEILKGIATDTIQVKSITVHNNGATLQQVQLVKNSTKVTKVFKLEAGNVLRFDENGWPNREVGTVIEVTGTGEVNGLTLTGNVDSKGSLTLGGTLSVSGNDFASQSSKLFFASPNNEYGKPFFRAVAVTDLPDLSALYSVVSHDHDLVYSKLTHNHDDEYSPLGHNHEGWYSLLTHDHAGVYSPLGHDHDDDYQPLSEALTNLDMTVQLDVDGGFLRKDSNGSWTFSGQQQPAISNATYSNDGEAYQKLNAIIAVLRSHGLIAS